MNLFPSALQRRREPPSAALIRIFQSETAEIREDPEPFQLRLTLLLKGQGAPQDAEEAFGWCRAAAEQALSEAQLQLGDLYRAGLGTPEDLLTARTWYEKAAAQRKPEAAARLHTLRDSLAG